MALAGRALDSSQCGIMTPEQAGGAGDGEEGGKVGRGAGEAAALWGELVGRLAERLAHEIRNPLNGAMVNLQVVVSRAERSTADAAALAPFATSALAELERATSTMEGLLAVLRPPPPEEEVATALRLLGAVYAHAARRNGGALEVQPGSDASTSTLDPATVRVAIAAVLERATRQGGVAEVLLEADERNARVRVSGPGLEPMEEQLAALLRRAGVSAEFASGEYILQLPRSRSGTDA